MAAKLKKFEEDEDKEIGYEGEHPAEEIGKYAISLSDILYKHF